MSDGVQMKREPDDVIPELPRAFNGDVATYRRQLAGSRISDAVSFCTQTSSAVNARVPITAFSTSGIRYNLVHKYFNLKVSKGDQGLTVCLQFGQFLF